MIQYVLLGVVLLLGHALHDVAGQCDEGTPLYDFGLHHGDVLIQGDDGPPGILDTTDVSPETAFRYYGYDYTKIYINLNGLISFGDASDPDDNNAMTDFFPTPSAIPDPAFLTPCWSDLFTGPGEILYRQSTNPDELQKAAKDVLKVGKNINPTSVIVATWYNVSSFDHLVEADLNASFVLPTNTFQAVLIMDNSGLSFTFFNYYRMTWYISHSLPSVAMLNRGRYSSQNLNLYASGSALMLDLPQTCANAGVYGRFVIQTSLDNIKILDRPSREVLERCYLKDNSLYNYGAEAGDTVISTGDDGPPGEVIFSNPVTFYGAEHTKAYVNINGPLSYSHPYLQYWPSDEPVDEVSFIAAFWNDISLDNSNGEVSYRTTNDTKTLARFKGDVGTIAKVVNPTELLIATWSRVQAFGATEDDGESTFQVVFGYVGNRSYTLMLYAYTGWYQDMNGHFAVSMFNKGASSGVALDVGPPPGPEWFVRHMNGNSVNKPGMYVYETHKEEIVKHDSTCVCKMNKRKWITTFDGMRHPILHAQKTRMSWYLKRANPCKLQLTVSTTPTTGGDFKITWIAFAFGVHEANSTKFDKNIAIQRFLNGTVEIRGRGYNGADVIHPPWSWKSSDKKTHVRISGDQYGGWVINSTTCPYRVQYAPNCPDPVVTLTLGKAVYKPKYLVGMCQDCNGDPNNDYRPCKKDPVDDWLFWKKIPDVSQTCLDPSK